MRDAAILERPSQEMQSFSYDLNPYAIDPTIAHLGVIGPSIPANEIAYLDFETPSIWLSAAVIPELATARKEAMLEAETLLEARMQHLRDGEYDLVPLDIDPLSTAARAVMAKKEYGERSLEYKKARHSLEVDCQRLFAEAWRKNSWEYFEPLEQEFDIERNCYTYMGRSLTEMVSDGITPLAEVEENTARLHEYVEEKTAVAAQRLGALSLKRYVASASKGPAVTVNTINECPDWAIENYRSGKNDQLGGYKPEKETMMVRSLRIENGVRYLEQLAIPVRHHDKTYITREVIAETMRRTGVIGTASMPTKTEVRATQMINFNGEGVLDIIKKLDDVAGEMSGETIFLGEKVAADHPRNYAAIPQEASERQEKLKTDSSALAEKLIELEEKKIDHFAATGIVSAFVTNRLLQKVKDDATQAEIVFDKKTADGVREYQARRAQGDRNADLFWLQVQVEAPSASFCGAGSCGLESASALSKEGQKAIERGLKTTDGTLIYDAERSCPGCDKKTIYYDNNGSKVCINCDKKEIKPK